MPITVTCEHCKKTMKVVDTMSGWRGKCPHCKGKIDVPDVTLGSAALIRTKDTPAPPAVDPNAVIVPCGKCGNELINEADIAGQLVECPHCGTHLQMPPLSGVAAGLPPPPAFSPPAMPPRDDSVANYNISGASSKRMAAGITGILLGQFGVHKFVLGYPVEGVVLLFPSLFGWFVGIGGFLFGLCCIIGWIGLFFLALPAMAAVIGLVEGILYLTKSDAEFVHTYQIGSRRWF
jgi:TM2 domain-containing membrane protein YozV/DNA-directed RNA polymerase subunit RPC12/RpoP